MLALGVVYACLMTYVAASIARERTTPFAYADITPADAYPRQLCPGNPLLFDLRVTVSNAPGVVQVVENWQSADGRTVADLSPVWHIQERPKLVEVPARVSIPNLPPGVWTYERAGTVPGVPDPAVLMIPFTVRDDCP